MLCAIHHTRHRVNHARSRLGLAPLGYRWMAERYPTLRLRILAYWRRTLTRTQRRVRAMLAAPWLNGGWYQGAMCVHSHEGAWDSNTGNGYYGGMQFSLSTWQANGGSGRPDLASPSEQLRISYRTWQSSGWNPWPSTARMCGLL